MKPRPKGRLLEQSHGCFQLPARWVFSRKYQGLSGHYTKHFLNLLCMIHLQGGVLLNPEEARVALGMYKPRFQAFLEAMLKQKFIKQTDAGYVPFDEDYFDVYVPPAERHKRRMATLWRERERRMSRIKTKSMEPIAVQGAKSVLAFLNKVTGKEFITEIHGKPSPAVELLASRLAKGETTITTLKSLISQVAQSCGSWEERDEKLKPSVLF